MKKLSVIALAALLFVGAGCSLKPTPTPPPQEEISVSIEGSWELQTFSAPGKGNQDVSKLGATLTVEAGGHLTAKICNSMSGEYVIDKGVLKAEQLMSTKMFCEGQAGEIEAVFSQGITDGMTTELRGTTLVLRSSTGDTFSYERSVENARVGMPSDEESGEDRTYVGTVTSVDLEKMAVDGPAVVVLRTAAGTDATILVPSFGLNLCKAKASMADVSTLKVGQTVEARGSIGVDGAIVPCESEAHYLRVVTK